MPYLILDSKHLEPLIPSEGTNGYKKRKRLLLSAGGYKYFTLMAGQIWQILQRLSYRLFHLQSNNMTVFHQ